MLDLAAVGFEPVTLIEDLDEVPRVGVALFRGVSFKFRPSSSPPTSAPRGLWCDLVPENPADGLCVLADGEIRPRKGSTTAREFEVRWTSLGSPGLASHPRIRHLLADFLDRLAAGTSTDAHWDVFIVEHYPDRVAEEVRTRCAGMLGGERAASPIEPAQRGQLLDWAQTLRRAGKQGVAADGAPQRFGWGHLGASLRGRRAQFVEPKVAPVGPSVLRLTFSVWPRS